jgi:hypothetical protein
LIGRKGNALVSVNEEDRNVDLDSENRRSLPGVEKDVGLHTDTCLTSAK